MYDLIGDIHGHADELVRLLEQLGYDRRRGYYSHPARRAIYVGDFIDRGPHIREVLALVRPMIDCGSALAVMGNHEFNAICYHTRHSADATEFLRPHEAKNIQQHFQTLRQLSPAELYDHVQWFRQLPLWLDLDGLRVVHACWDPPQIGVIRQALETHGGLTQAFLEQATDLNEPLFSAIEEVLKGKEINLPGEMSYLDKDGHERRTMRIRWYQSPAGHTLRSYALTAESRFPEQPVGRGATEQLVPYPESDPPVFFGHYWLQTEHPGRLAANVACLDYSVAKGGLLCAYRWSGERTLRDENFVYVKAR